MSGAAPPPPPGRPEGLQAAADARPRPLPLMSRIALGVLVFLGLYLALVTLPTFAIQTLSSNNLPISLSPQNIIWYGTILALLSAAAYIVRPTRAYGPVAMAVGVVEIGYLVTLYAASPFHASFSGSGGSGSLAIQIGASLIVLVLIVATLLSLAGHAVTTAEDLQHPGERLWWSYPIR